MNEIYWRKKISHEFMLKFLDASPFKFILNNLSDEGHPIWPCGEGRLYRCGQIDWREFLMISICQSVLTRATTFILGLNHNIVHQYEIVTSDKDYSRYGDEYS